MKTFILIVMVMTLAATAVQANVPGAPAATTLAATNVTLSSATLNGTMSANTAVTTGWFRYSSTDPVICNDSFGTRVPVSSASDFTFDAGTTSVPYSLGISSLTSATKYYYCAIGSNANGRSSGTVISFTTPATVTPSAGPKGSITPATPQSVNNSATTQFTIKPNFGYHVVIPVGGTCGGSNTGNPYDTANGITYTTGAITADCTVAAAFSLNSTAPPSSGLMAWWKAEGNANDSAGVYTGTVTNVSYATGKFGQAFSFSNSGCTYTSTGSCSYVTITDNGAFDFTGKPFAYAAWVKITGDFTGEQGFGTVFDRIGNSGGYRLDYAPSSNIIRLLGLGTSLTGNSAVQMNKNTWYHIAAVADGAGNATIYINGAVALSGPYSAGTGSEPGVTTRIGECHNLGGAPFNGLIDEVQVYNRALTPDEVLAIYNILAPITINSGAPYTTSTAATLTLGCPYEGGCSEMRFSTNNIDWLAAVPYADTTQWTLAAGDGVKTVYVEFWRGESWSDVFSADIFLDATPPVSAVYFPVGPFTSTPPRNARFSCNDGAGSGCAEICYTTDGTAPTTSSSIYTAPIPLNVGMTIRFFSVDKAGNSEAPQTRVYNPAPQVSAGANHSCGVRTDGTVACWGNNDLGQAAPPAGTFLEVSAGYGYNCAVRTDGSVTCWGDNYYGQAAPAAGAFLEVSAGGYHSCGVRTDGTAACWGAGTTNTGALPELGQSIPPTGTFLEVSAGVVHSCGVRTGGTVACWGRNDSGQAAPPDGTFLEVSAGADHSCGVRTDGTVACWGLNDHGQAAPPAGTFLEVSAGWYHSCGVRTDGTVACWGLNDHGQAAPPAGTFLEVSTGNLLSCGVRTDGTVTCWGRNDSGQAPAVSFAPATLPNGTYAASYSQVLTGSGGTSPYTFSVTSGSLPAGLTLSGAGVLSGAPTVLGGYSFTIQALDATGLVGVFRGYTLTIDKAPTTTTLGSSPNPATYGQSVAMAAIISSGTGTVTFSEGGAVYCSAVPLSGTIAMCSTSALTGGSHTITATYSGDNTHNGSFGAAEQSVTPATVSLSIGFAGAGGNKVESTSPDHGINCLKGNSSGCSAGFTTGLPVTLVATADWKSIFSGWSANAPAGVVTMDSDKTVTATFDVVNRARLSLAGTLYADIQDACDAVASGDTILAQEYFFQEPQGVTIGAVTAKTITISGGYKPDDANYNTITGMTTVQGPVKIGQGSLTVERLIVK